MNKCVYCNKEINTEWDNNFKWYGIDGDVIHKDCNEKQNKRICKINNMSDNEFKDYIVK